MKQPDHGSQTTSNFLSVNDCPDVLLCGYSTWSANNEEFPPHIPMSLMVSPGSKGGSSISANLFVSLRT